MLNKNWNFENPFSPQEKDKSNFKKKRKLEIDVDKIENDYFKKVEEDTVDPLSEKKDVNIVKSPKPSSENDDLNKSQMRLALGSEQMLREKSNKVQSPHPR
jgi:hypothetical protein